MLHVFIINQKLHVLSYSNFTKNIQITHSANKQWNDKFVCFSNNILLSIRFDGSFPVIFFLCLMVVNQAHKIHIWFTDEGWKLFVNRKKLIHWCYLWRSVAVGSYDRILCHDEDILKPLKLSIINHDITCEHSPHSNNFHSPSTLPNILPPPYCT